MLVVLGRRALCSWHICKTSPKEPRKPKLFICTCPFLGNSLSFLQVGGSRDTQILSSEKCVCTALLRRGACDGEILWCKKLALWIIAGKKKAVGFQGEEIKISLTRVIPFKAWRVAVGTPGPPVFMPRGRLFVCFHNSNTFFLHPHSVSVVQVCV